MFATIAIVGTIILFLGCGIFVGLAADRDLEDAPFQAPAKKRSIIMQATTDEVAERPAPAIAYVDPVAVQRALSLLERHVRQEQAAVEDFLSYPSAERLRTNTTSALAN